MKKFLTYLVAAIMAAGPLAVGVPAQNVSIASRTAGVFVASNYSRWFSSIVSGISTAATGAIIVTNPGALPDGHSFIPFSVTAPVTVDGETETPTAVAPATCPSGSGATLGCTSITAAWSNAHPGGINNVTSGTFGLQEAINDAFASGGGTIVVDNTFGGTNSTLTAAVPFASVNIADYRTADVQYWRPVQANATTLATPIALVAQAACDSTHYFCSDPTAVGTWTAAAYYGCISYVDIMGNEGTCSSTANFTAVVSKAIDVGFAGGSGPAASAGAVGYKIYLGTSYAAAVEVPLSSSVCTLTTIETVTAACRVTNATYGQTGVNAQVATLTVTTSKLALNATTTSSTTDYVGNPGSVTSYKYAPTSRVGVTGLLAAYNFFPVGAAAATTVPNVIGTVVLPAGYMNYVGRSLELCGFATEASGGSTATISDVQLWWDANGSDTATGVPILIGTTPSTNTLVTAKTDQLQFCYDIRTTVAGASVTAGSIIQDASWYINQYASSGVATVPKIQLNQGPAAVASLNLAGEARIHIVWLHTTGTDGAGVQLTHVTLRDIS